VAQTGRKQGIMRIETTETRFYRLEELDEETQERAREMCNMTEDYHWRHEAMDSLKAFVNYFGHGLRDWQISFTGCSYSSVSFGDCYHLEDDEEINEVRELLDALGPYNKDTFRGDGTCLLTGYCLDEALKDGFRAEWEEGNRDMKELLEAAFYSWLAAVHADYEYQTSRESFREMCEANEYEFTEDGELCLTKFGEKS